MLLPHGAVIALVDGDTLELFRNSGSEAEPVLSSIESPTLDEHNKNSGARHHSSSAEPSGHQLAEDAHAAGVASWLNHQVVANSITHLVIIAAPRTLGEMRRHYHERLKTALIGELHKDFVGRGGPSVLEALRGK
jgi:protein required for attachment to host cells